MELTKSLQDKSLFEKFFAPVELIVTKCNNYRKCSVLTDGQWIETGVLRAVFQEPSGRGFLQSIRDIGISLLKKSTFFETLKSNRRLGLCKEVNATLCKQSSEQLECTDPFKEFTELGDYDIYAGDGHYHKAACHTQLKDGKKYPVLHFYSVNLRNHFLSHLTISDSVNRKREHDMRALKRLDKKQLRQNAPKGRKVIYTWDKAGINFRQWYKWKKGSGIYFISVQKENMSLQKLGDIPFEKSSPINNGVLSYEIVSDSNGTDLLRRVTYRCPETNKIFSFITNLTNISPGLIAYIYKCRWNIEKIFDQLKNKMMEKKAWATSDTAKTMQAEFICLSHNLMLLLEHKLKTEEDIENNIEKKRKKNRCQHVINKIQKNGDDVPICFKTIQRFTQISVKFIRWLRNNIQKQSSWAASLDSLRMAYNEF